jgi:DNA-binding CsgD family transcriptional regulator
MVRPEIPRFAPPPDLDLERLPPRERQIARLFLGGLKPSMIARRLGLAESTVRNYIRRIQWRRVAGNRAEVTAGATTYGATRAPDLRTTVGVNRPLAALMAPSAARGGGGQGEAPATP